MPHSVIVALQAALPLIEKLLPLIEKFIDMLSGSATKYNNGEMSTKDFLKDANDKLKAMQREAATNNVMGDEFTFPDDINSAEECKEVADTLQRLIDEGKVPAKSIDQYKEVITGMRKAEAEFRRDGVIKDPDAVAAPAPSPGLLPMGRGIIHA